MDVAARQWLKENGTQPMVIENMSRLLSYREQGHPPYIGGSPVVACGEPSVEGGAIFGIDIPDEAKK
jgi:hypothetical protein